jgi:hypothetical protein
MSEAASDLYIDPGHEQMSTEPAALTPEQLSAPAYDERTLTPAAPSVDAVHESVQPAHR